MKNVMIYKRKFNQAHNEIVLRIYLYYSLAKIIPALLYTVVAK